jgi:hypothetical protein
MLKSCVAISTLSFNSQNRYTNLQTCNVSHQVGSNAHSVDKRFEGIQHEANFEADLADTLLMLVAAFLAACWACSFTLMMEAA